MARDSQRQKEYSAEWEAEDHLKESNPEIAQHLFHPLDLPTLQIECDKIIGSRWWRGIRWFRQWATDREPRSIRLKGTSGSGANAYQFEGLITMSPQGRRRITLYHELAHMAAPLSDPGHGLAFCRAYLEILYRWAGPEAYRALREAYKTRNVRHTR